MLDDIVEGEAYFSGLLVLYVYFWGQFMPLIWSLCLFG